MSENAPKDGNDTQDKHASVRSDQWKKIAELEIQLKKALADYQNLKKDMEKSLEFENSLIRAGVLRSLVAIADDIDVAMDHVDDEKGWRDGVSLILDKFRTVMEDLGARMIEVMEGEEFDANKHEAVGVVPDGDAGKIAKVLQSGYMYGDMVVRPARVLVYKMSSDSK